MMTNKRRKSLFTAIGVFVLVAGLALLATIRHRETPPKTFSAPPAQTSARILELPPPRLDSTPLRDALLRRASARTFQARALDSQSLSNLLWAANGVNRPKTGSRTAPSAYDWRHVDLYLADANGVWLYIAPQHALERVGHTDIRSLTGVQDFVKTAPLTIVLVSDEAKFDPKEPQEMRAIFSGVSTGAIAQNIYLYAAASGLNAVVRASIDRPALHKALGLRKEQKIIVGQTVGFPP